PHVSLNDAGDHVRLLLPDGVTIRDDIVYGSSKEGYSYNRIDAETYQQSSMPTPNSANILDPTPAPSPTLTPTITPTSSIPPSPTAPPVYSSNIYINEFIPNPIGDDSKLEFIELYNSSSETVDISGWSVDDIADGGSAPFIIPAGAEIPGHEYVVFYSDQTKLSLNNDSDHVRLLKPDGSVQGDWSYETSKEGYSYNRVDDGDFQQSVRITPGEENIIELPTPTPSPTPKPTATPKIIKPTSTPAVYDFSSKIVLNEIYQNPGKDDKNNEFIEIKNLENRTVSLAGWLLDDEDGGSRPYHFKSDAKIGPKKILAFDKTITKIALNNDNDSARLINPKGQVIAIISYEKTYSGKAYSRLDDGSYSWTDIATPGNENIIRVQETVSPKPKQATSKKSVARPRVAGIVSGKIIAPSISLLPAWPDVDSKEVLQTIVGKSSIPSKDAQKQKIFIFFGALCASFQLVSGVSRKEKIWFG
ncbi:MAG: lamin tail domain-containing protein, partial [Candidatus Andersenbacteria bacterium]